MPMRRVLLAGLTAMAAVALTSAIWPGFAGIVGAIFGAVLTLALLTPALIGARRLWPASAVRREQGGLAQPTAQWAAGPPPSGRTLAQLRESA